MKRYAEYKDSGTPWIGEIPKEWDIIRTKYACVISTGNRDTVDSELNGLYPFYVRSKTIERINTFAYDGEAILTAGDGDIGEIFHYINGRFDYHQRVYCFKKFLSNIASRYFYYYISNGLKYEIAKYSAKTTVESMRLPWLLNFPVVLPPLQDQQTIADYLDRKTSTVDTLIADKQKLIDLLKEKRLVAISEAVTKGLDKNVKMKDSGIEWIGDIPQHWDVYKLRYLGSCQNGLSKAGEYFGSGYPFVSYGDVYKNYELPQEVEGLVESTEVERENCSVKRGDVFFTRTSETIEEVALTSTCLMTVENATFAGFLIRFRPYTQDNIIPEFSKYYFRSQQHRAYFVKEMNLVTRASLSQELLKNFPILLPRIEEQYAIAKYLECMTSAIDSLISDITTQIEKLKAYRQSIISEAVTGKVAI
jgi:type I restriction enzyme S subunit